MCLALQLPVPSQLVRAQNNCLAGTHPTQTHNFPTASKKTPWAQGKPRLRAGTRRGVIGCGTGTLPGKQALSTLLAQTYSCFCPSMAVSRLILARKQRRFTLPPRYTLSGQCFRLFPPKVEVFVRRLPRVLIFMHVYVGLEARSAAEYASGDKAQEVNAFKPS